MRRCGAAGVDCIRRHSANKRLSATSSSGHSNGVGTVRVLPRRAPNRGRLSCRYASLQSRSPNSSWPRHASIAHLPGVAQDHHRPAAQLYRRQARDLRTGGCPTCVRQGSRPREQSRREQPPTDSGTRASYARVARPATHATLPVVLWSDPPTFRAEEAPITRGAPSQTTRYPLRRLARVHWRGPESVSDKLRLSSVAFSSSMVVKLTMPRIAIE